MATDTTTLKGKYTESLTFSTLNCIYADYGKLDKPSLQEPLLSVCLCSCSSKFLYFTYLHWLQLCDLAHSKLCIFPSLHVHPKSALFEADSLRLLLTTCDHHLLSLPFLFLH